MTRARLAALERVAEAGRAVVGAHGVLNDPNYRPHDFSALDDILAEHAAIDALRAALAAVPEEAEGPPLEGRHPKANPACRSFYCDGARSYCPPVAPSPSGTPEGET